MAVYCTFRLLTSIAELYAESLKNAFNGLTVLVYLSVMFIGQYYGQKLLKKMKTVRCLRRVCARAAQLPTSPPPPTPLQMTNKEFKRQLTKLTVFIILENVVLLLLLLVFIIRTFFFSGDKDNKPWLWFWLKQVEKVLELISAL